MSSDESKKIIIDEDWKSQVEREKQEAPEPTPEQADPANGGLPPASFSLLISTLATQCLAALGQIPDPMNNNQLSMNLPLATHFMEMLAMLEEKTSGNLDEEEKKGLDEILHQLRMVFVAANEQQA